MKIFSWVHRRFNNKAENVKKEDEQTFPGENDVWRGGILAIGTFGYDPLKDENDERLIKGYYSREEEEEEEEEEDDDDSDEEHNPLVVSTTHNFNAGESMAMGLTEMETAENWSPEEEDELQVGFEYVMMKKQVRTTLADLFTADSQHDTNTKKLNNLKKKPADYLKEKSNDQLQGHSFANKQARPIHKINQVMRRMLKRKIHPHVGPTNSKVAAMKTSTSCNTTTDDYASLLPTLDANM